MKILVLKYTHTHTHTPYVAVEKEDQRCSREAAVLGVAGKLKEAGQRLLTAHTSTCAINTHRCEDWVY